ncbi:MAG: M81 family metallopeptidase, partial [Alphaproteobacteria bacterium]|nr:M81 family metallopeptidase [Alphaproteobacteria bacterium]
MARIAIGGFMHETNCFVPELTDYQHFARPADRPGILRGEENSWVLGGRASWLRNMSFDRGFRWY